MAQINITYCNDNKRYYVIYDDVSHSIVYEDAFDAVCGPAPGSHIDAGNVADGGTIYTDVVVDGTYTVVAKPAISGYWAEVGFVGSPAILIACREESVKNVSSPGASDGEIVVSGFPGLNGPFEFQLGLGAWQASGTFSGLAIGDYQVRCRRQADTSVVSSYINITVGVAPSLSATFSKTNVSVNGGSDGSISVNTTGGSGSYSYLWADGPTTANRTGLSANTYTLTITDDVTGATFVLAVEITEPALVTPPPEFFAVPPMQSIHFHPNESTNELVTFETLDNKAFSLQKKPSPMYSDFCYYQKVYKTQIPIQVQSNREGNVVEVYDQDDVKIKTVNLVKTAQYTAQISQYSVDLKDHGSSQTQVFFAGETTLPLALEEGNTFEIINNAEGMNGLYQIIGIEATLAGVQYLVINKAYAGAGASSSAEAKFSINKLNYDIYEGTVSFSGYDSGYYYLKAYNPEADAWYSEIIQVLDPKNRLNYINWSNYDNAFGIDYTNTIEHKAWVESIFLKRIPESTNETLRNTDQTAVKLKGVVRRRILLEIIDVPPYLIEKLAVAFAHDVVKINGIRYISLEGLEEPEYQEMYGFAKARVILEQVDWLDDYNSNDLAGSGGIDDYISIDEDYLKANF